MDLEPNPKRPRRLDPNICIICNDKLSGNVTDTSNIVKNPTNDGLKVLFNACDLRKDDMHERLLPFREDILERKINVSYHKSCRSGYVSKSNLIHVCTDEVDVPTTAEPSCSAISGNLKRRRDETSTFNIRQNCFVCGVSQKILNRQREKLTQITTGTGQSTREKVLRAATARKDEVVILRMTAYPDLFAFDGKYHRSCLSHYLSERNITALQRKCECAVDQGSSPSDVAFKHIVEDIGNTVLSKHKTVTTLSQIRTTFVSKLEEFQPGTDVYSWKLKEKLKAHFKGELVFVERRGLSDLVCSSTVSVGDALRKAAELQDSQQQESYEDLQGMVSASGHTDEKHVLHTAAGILRMHLANITEAKHHYDPSSKIALGPCAEFVPDVLYDFMSWLTDVTIYKNVSSCTDSSLAKSNISTISICHEIIAKARHIRTPITLGLGLYVHHEFGSKQLVQELNALGHSISYDEVRRFLTSASVDQQNRELYVPRGLQSPSDERILIDAAIDNFDQNEETLDGKSTTHAMAAVIYKRCDAQPADELPIVRVMQKSSMNSENDDALKRYHKPTHRPQPSRVLDSMFTSSDTSVVSNGAEYRDLLWKICRISKSEDTQLVPSWTGFNSFIAEQTQHVAMIRYLPFIRAPPTDLSTIYSILLKLVQLAETLGQSHILVTADMAIYSKAQEILWAQPPELVGKVTMRVGGMHLTMAFLASLGSLYGDGGLLSLLTDSEVYANETARKMLHGKAYSRGVRGVKLVHEALFRLFFMSMESWLTRQGRCSQTAELDQKISELEKAIESKNAVLAASLAAETESEHLSSVKDLIDEYRQVGRKTSKTFAYWDTFLQGADLLLGMLRAERDAKFDLHLNVICELIPWLWAAGRHTYAKFIPTYVADMKAMEVAHPESYQHMQNGAFVVRRAAHHGFNCVATDQALEQTVNRDGKSKGGVIGLTLRKGALSRWLITRHITAEYKVSFKALCAVGTNTNKAHEELGKARIARDERDVCQIMDAAQQYQNPFDLDTVPSEWINISTGHVASAGVSRSLSTFLESGLQKHQGFINQRLVEGTKSKSFWDP